MNKNTRMKMIAAGLIATAAVALPACSATQAVTGTPVASTTGVAEYKAEQTTAPAATPVANPAPQAPVNAPETQVDKVSPEYREIARVIERAIKDFDKFITANYAGDMDITINVAERMPSTVGSCTRPSDDSYSAGMACVGSRDVVLYLPNMLKRYQAGGEVGVYHVVAHELSHIVIRDLEPTAEWSKNDEELKATCGSGAFMNNATAVNGWDVKDVLVKLRKSVRYQQEYDAFVYGMKKGYDSCLGYVEGMK